jgi:folylpolyglutamate synthase/dihydrofolate synthase
LKERNVKESIQATEFELLTATAFKIFNEEQVQAGVIEVGMGGAHDATNVLKHKSVTVISRIGLDHQEFLGNTLEDITTEKCGIFAQGVPVIYDELNEPEVLKEIRRQAYRRFTTPLQEPHFNYFPAMGRTQVGRMKKRFKEVFGDKPFLEQNAAIAYQSAFVFLASMGIKPKHDLLGDAIKATRVPGRLQMVHLKSIVGRPVQALLDGAHNPQAVASVQRAIGKAIRKKGPVFWVFSFSDGKPLDQMILPLIRSGDSIATVEFGPVDGMPWKTAMPSSQITEFLNNALSDKLKLNVKDFGPRIRDALQWCATQNSDSKSIVILGSLYLVSDVLRMIRDAGGDIESRPFSSDRSVDSLHHKRLELKPLLDDE